MCRTRVAPSCTTPSFFISSSACDTEPISTNAVPLKSRLFTCLRSRMLFTVPCSPKKAISSERATATRRRVSMARACE